jgi:hypothetical protein
MSTLDTLAEKAEAASKRFAGEGGIKGKLAVELAEDAAFLRQLKPALIAKRAKGAAPTDREPGEAPRAPSGPQLGSRSRRSGGGPNPFLIVGAALVAGVALAKWIDWRGHAHPRW